jgi:hypothetical protein
VGFQPTERLKPRRASDPERVFQSNPEESGEMISNSREACASGMVFAKSLRGFVSEHEPEILHESFTDSKDYEAAGNSGVGLCSSACVWGPGVSSHRKGWIGKQSVRAIPYSCRSNAEARHRAPDSSGGMASQERDSSQAVRSTPSG